MAIRTTSSSTHVFVEAINDHNNQTQCTINFTVEQLDHFLWLLSQHRAALVASRARQTRSTHAQHREAGPAHAGMSPGGHGAWQGYTGSGYGGGGCGNGL